MLPEVLVYCLVTRGVPEVAGAETHWSVEAGRRGAGAEAWDPGSGIAERRLDPGSKRRTVAGGKLRAAAESQVAFLREVSGSSCLSSPES